MTHQPEATRESSTQTPLEAVISSQLNLSLTEEQTRELIDATRDRVGKTLTWPKDEFEAAQIVIERIAGYCFGQGATTEPTVSFSGHTPPAPFFEFTRDIPTHFREVALPHNAFTLQDRRVLLFQDIIREPRRPVDITVDEMGMREIIRREASTGEYATVKSLEAVLKHPHVQWGVRPPRAYTEASDAFYALPYGTVVQFSELSGMSKEGTAHGDSRYFIHTGEKAKTAMKENSVKREDLSLNGRGNDYLSYLLTLVS